MTFPQFVSRKYSAICSKTVSFLCLIFCSLVTFAQDDFKPKPGVIDRASFDITSAMGDSTAEAIVLYDYGNVTFSYDDAMGIYMRLECHIRIKILKESALGRASVRLRYKNGASYDQAERIGQIVGYTYNLNDGQIVTSQLDRKSIVTEKLGEGYAAENFNLPNVRKGSVIEYTYVKESPLNAKIEPDTWSFQNSIPVKWSEYRIVIPYYLEYKMTLGGYLRLFVNKQEQVNVSMGSSRLDGPGLSYRFVVKDAPAFVDEPFITTENDYLSRIRFELASVSIPGGTRKRYSQTWEQVDETLNNAKWFGLDLRKNIFEDDFIAGLLKSNPDSAERMNLGYAFIRKTIKWDETVSMGSFDGLRKAYDNKKGNAADINLLLTNLLRKLNLDADPVVLSTRSHGQVFENLPLLDGFNYVVCRVKIGAKEYLLDATEPYGKPGILPERAVNKIGRVIPRKKQGYFIDLKPKENKGKLEIVEAEILLEEGILKGKYSVSLAGYEALNWRNQYGSASESTFEESFTKQFPEWKVDNVKVSNKSDNLESSVNITCNIEIEDENSSPGIFYFNPMMAARLHENPLKNHERIYPLDFSAGISSSYIGKFKLPEGYALEEIPKTDAIVLPEKGGRFLFQVKQTGNLIEVSSSMMINKLSFMPGEYGALREFFERVVQRHAQPLVIKKKTN